MRSTVLCLLLVFTQSGFADWTLDGERSSISFVSIKNNQVAEVHRFQALVGNVNANGSAKVDIVLASVETNIPIRNDRMKSMLFETDSFELASASAQLNVQEFAGLEMGESLHSDIAFEVDLHGMKAPVNAKVRVTRTTETVWQVASIHPMIVNASAFKLGQGIESLRAIAGLNSIGAAVPVVFDLEFMKQ